MDVAPRAQLEVARRQGRELHVHVSRGLAALVLGDGVGQVAIAVVVGRELGLGEGLVEFAVTVDVDPAHEAAISSRNDAQRVDQTIGVGRKDIDRALQDDVLSGHQFKALAGRQAAVQAERAPRLQDQRVGAQGVRKTLGKRAVVRDDAAGVGDGGAKREHRAGAVLHPGRRVEEAVELDAILRDEGCPAIELDRVVGARGGGRPARRLDHDDRVLQAGHADHVATHHTRRTDSQGVGCCQVDLSRHGPGLGITSRADSRLQHVQAE